MVLYKFAEWPDNVNINGIIIAAVENPDFRSDVDETVTCDYESTKQATERQSCRVDTSKFGPCNKAKKFGYGTGEPCILLKLNRVRNPNGPHYVIC